MAWKAHNLRLLTEAAQGIDSGVKRMIVKYGGTMLGFRLSSLAVDALGAAGLPYESARRGRRGRRRDDLEHRLHVRCRPDDRRRLHQHPEEHHRRTRPRPAARTESKGIAMDFGLTLEQRQFDNSLRAFLADHLPMERLRALAEPGTGYDEDLWHGLAELGLHGLLVPERFGGAGLGILDAALAAEALGYAAAPVPYVGSIVMATLAFINSATEAQQDEYLPMIAAGECRFAVALPGLAGQTGGCLGPADRGPPVRPASPASPMPGPATHFLVYLPDGHAAVVAAGRAGRVQPHPAQHRPHPSGRRRHLRRRPGGAPGRRQRAAGSRTSRAGRRPRHARRRHAGRRPAHARCRRRLRQGTRAVRPRHRQLPGREIHPGRMRHRTGTLPRRWSGTRPTPRTRCRTKPG